MLQPHVILPCKPRVLQYLVNKYPSSLLPSTDTTIRRTIELPVRDPYLMLVYNFLERATARNESMHTMQHYTCEVHIPILFEAYERYGIELSRDHIVAINNRIEEVIHDQLDMVLQFYTSVGFDVKDAAEIFRRAYNFPEESYSSDAIAKHWQRHTRKSVTVHNIIGKTVLSNNSHKTGT